MADYINKNILSQAYIHVEPKNLSTAEDIAKFKEHILEFAKSRSSFYLYPEIEVDIVFEEGSLKGRITLIGSIFLLIQGVSNYPDFREGATLLYSDSKRLAEYIVSEAQFMAGAKHESVIQVESRTGIVGSIHKVTNQLEAIVHSSEGTLNARELTEKIKDARSDIDKLFMNLRNPQDIKSVQDGLSGIVSRIPMTPKPPKRREDSSEAILRYQEERWKIREYFSL